MILTTLPPTPPTITRIHEIAITYNTALPNLFNTLSSEEKIFIYYLMRASLPGNQIFADQVHRHSNTIINLFEKIFTYTKNNQTIKNNLPHTFPYEKFVEETHTYLVYLWTNHGQYFQREHNEEKRTPEKLKLFTLTFENIKTILTMANLNDEIKTITELRNTIFDSSYEATSTTPGSIDQSSINIYSQDFTDALYQTLSEQQQQQLNAYFYTINNNGISTAESLAYGINKKYSNELSVSAHWLSLALSHAQTHPHYFDEYLIKSLALLIEFLITGDEEYFKQHSIAWLASNSRLDYNFGFIETYQDPKGVRGFFQAEATIKSVNINKLNAFLPTIEAQLPLPEEFKRPGLSNGTAPIPNASINLQVFGVGALGPLSITAAYCLPNYEEIRALHGSKQIIYPAAKSVEQHLNADLARNLFNLKKEAEWLKQNDPEGNLANEIWDVQCILHETIGHASGNLAEHIVTDKEASAMHNPSLSGSKITVTNKNLSDFLSGYESTIEELRAEIIALYVSINHLPELQSCGLLTSWNHILSNEELIKELIIGMAQTGLRRLIQQTENATEIAGDHARANYCILNYLIDHKGLSLQEETLTINDTNYTIIGLTIIDFEQTKKLITKLMILVQTIKSTGNRDLAEHLIETYGKKLRHPQQMKILQQNKKAITGDIKVSCSLYPIFNPVRDEQGTIVDIAASWPKSLDEMQEFYRLISLSIE